MKQFFKFMFASMLGTILTIILIFFIFMGLIISIASYAEDEAVKIDPNTILYVQFDEPIVDRTPNNPFENFNFEKFEASLPLGLNDILKNIKKASEDNNIKGIFMDISVIPAGIATVEEIRDALIEFKNSGKFIICFSNMFSQNAYYLATVADEVYFNPEGNMYFKGLHAEVMFLKGTLDKLDIEAQVIRAGKYKSAIEPLVRKDLSKENKEQIGGLLTTIWSQISGGIAEARNIDPYDLNTIANNLEVINARQALKHNFVDGLKYRDEIIELIKEKLGLGTDDKIKTISMEKYTHVKAVKKENKFTKDKIAVVYASGEIIMGEGDHHTIGSKRISEAIRKARKDKNVKAVVLRVDSPGGDALASEIIAREVELTTDEKPIIVSMGDVAASGGYWISCSADKILADPVTITGSIGVFGVIPNLKEFFNDKLGITFDEVKTNENADFISVNKPLSPFQEKVIEDEIDRIYHKFLQKVAKGRKLTTAQVDSIGQGRVWSGADAKRIGLVDEFGGLERAIAVAAEMAEITDYRIKELPELKDPFSEILEGLFGNQSTRVLQENLGEYYNYFEYIHSVSNMDGVQARLPYYIEIN